MIYLSPTLVDLCLNLDDWGGPEALKDRLQGRFATNELIEKGNQLEAEVLEVLAKDIEHPIAAHIRLKEHRLQYLRAKEWLEWEGSGYKLRGEADLIGLDCVYDVKFCKEYRGQKYVDRCQTAFYTIAGGKGFMEYLIMTAKGGFYTEKYRSPTPVRLIEMCRAAQVIAERNAPDEWADYQERKSWNDCPVYEVELKGGKSETHS